MGRRGRKQIMSKNSCFKPRCFFDGITLIALHDCVSPYELSPEQGETLERLKAYLRKQSYTVWCSKRSWENFLKHVIEKDKEEIFFDELMEKTREYQGDLYLTNDGYLKSARSLTRWDW